MSQSIEQSYLINTEDAPVRMSEHQISDGLKIAEIHLNSPSTLNALSLEMIDIITPLLEQWRKDDAVVCVVVNASGDKAFSAGGDIQALYHAMVANRQAGKIVDDYPARFFEREYRLGFALHTFPKPIVALGHGIIMGGGLGVFSAARHRVVTEATRIALPEITIGLFPDAGATHLLQQMPRHWATFIGLSGNQANSTDTLRMGVGTASIAASARHDLLPALAGIDWSGNDDSDVAIANMLANMPQTEMPVTELDAIPESLGDFSDGASTESVVEAVYALAGASKWVDRGVSTLRAGCPTTAGIVVQQLIRAQELSLADCFRLEMTVATHCATQPDFQEGVRALIIEKDGAPAWQFPEIATLPSQHVAAHFEAPWPRNPLEDLG